MRPDCALAWREASMKQRSPALETYSRWERSRMMAPPPCATESTYVISSRVKSPHVSWSSRPSTRRTMAFAKRREETFIVGVMGPAGAPIVSQPLFAEESEPLLRGAVRIGKDHPIFNTGERVFHPAGDDDHVVRRDVETAPASLDATVPLDAHEDHAVARAVWTSREARGDEPDHRGDGGHGPAAFDRVLVAHEVADMGIGLAL